MQKKANSRAVRLGAPPGDSGLMDVVSALIFFGRPATN
jgi:hypothetical protein